MAKQPLESSTVIREIANRILAENLNLTTESRAQAERMTKIGKTDGILDFTFYVKIYEAFSIEGELSVELRLDNAASRDGKFYRYDLIIRMSWPSAQRSITQAQASINLYQKLSTLGMSIKGMYEGEEIGDPIK
jgi:hypothetical protein